MRNGGGGNLFSGNRSVRCGGTDCTVSDNNAVHPCDKNEVKVKVKVTLEQATKAQRGNRGMTTLSLTSALGGHSHSPAALRLEKTRHPFYRRLGGPQGRSGRVWKMSPPTGIRSLDRPARSESLYLLSYPSPMTRMKQ